MKRLITGASGPFGRAVTEGLIAKGVPADSLILVSRNPEKLDDLAALGCDVRFGDFDDRASLEKAFAGAERLLMISTNRVGQREPQHENAVRAATTAGVAHILYTSFIGKPGCVSLAVSDHRFTEGLIRESGMGWTFLRNSQYSEAMRDAGGPAAIRSGEWLSATRGGKIALVTRDDCIAAALAVMGDDGDAHRNVTYDVTGPELLGYRQVCDMVAKIAGCEITYRDVTEDELYAVFDALGVPRSAKDDHVVNGFGWCSDDMVTFESTIAAGDFAVISDDFEKLTGRSPEALRSFLERYADHLRAVAKEARTV